MSSIIKSTDENSQIREAQAAEEVEDVIKRYEMDTRSTFIVYKKDKTFGSMGKYTHRYEYGTKSAHCNIDFCYEIKTCVQDGVTRFLLWLRC